MVDKTKVIAPSAGSALVRKIKISAAVTFCFPKQNTKRGEAQSEKDRSWAGPSELPYSLNFCDSATMNR